MSGRLLRAIGVVTGTLVVLLGCQTTRPPAGAPASSATYAHAAVAADHPVASAAGAEILRRGGNAVDAAVATSFCLSVVRPYSCGLGGGGFMVIHDPSTGVSVTIDYRETAPARVGPDYYADRPETAPRFGVHAVGVPGTVAGLLHALETYGTLDRRTVMTPAIRAARDGFAAGPHFVGEIRALGARLDEHPEHRGSAAFLWERLGRGGALAEGDLVRNPEQARALELISTHGADAFYRGPIGAAIVRRMEAEGGPVTAADLDGYTVRERAPLRGRYGAYDVIAMPPPSSGGITMLQIFGLLERQGIVPGGRHLPVAGSAPYIHAVTEAMKHAFADRAMWLADDAFVDVPLERLLSDAHLDDRAAMIDPSRTLPAEAYAVGGPLPVDGGTSHLSVIDANGMAVACTETVNLSFGSLVVVPEFGFVLNDEMDDFTTAAGRANAFGLIQSERNLPEPGKRPLSSMSPTIVLDPDGAVRVVAGASGGPRIITGTLQTILNILLFDERPAEAVARSRFHHQWLPDTLYFEASWADASVEEPLEGRGHVLGVREDVGKVQVVERWGGRLYAASDPRKHGAPAGW